MPKRISPKPHTNKAKTMRLAELVKPSTPPGLTATGFGDARAMGLLTPIADVNGHPAFQAAGGAWYFYWELLSRYTCSVTEPATSSNLNYIYLQLNVCETVNGTEWGDGPVMTGPPYGSIS